MSKAKILFINTEVDPYMPTSSPISLLGRILPQAMHNAGHEVRVFSPRFGIINERRNQLHEVIRLSGRNLDINGVDHSLVLKVASLMPQRIQVYFIDNEEFYSTRKFYCDKDGNEYPDQVERCLFYARGVAETVKRLRWTPDVIYCQGWFTAVVPMYLRKAKGEDPCFRKAKIILGLFDNEFKTPWSSTTSKILKVDGVTKNDIAEIREKPIDYKTLCKFSLKFCNGLVVNDNGVDPEIVEYARSFEKKILDVSDSPAGMIDSKKYSEYFESFFPKEKEEDAKE